MLARASAALLQADRRPKPDRGHRRRRGPRPGSRRRRIELDPRACRPGRVAGPLDLDGSESRNGFLPAGAGHRSGSGGPAPAGAGLAPRRRPRPRAAREPGARGGDPQTERRASRRPSSARSATTCARRSTAIRAGRGEPPDGTGARREPNATSSWSRCGSRRAPRPAGREPARPVAAAGGRRPPTPRALDAGRSGRAQRSTRWRESDRVDVVAALRHPSSSRSTRARSSACWPTCSRTPIGSRRPSRSGSSA